MRSRSWLFSLAQSFLAIDVPILSAWRVSRADGLHQKNHADIETCRWDHETNKQGDEGFMGKVQAFRKKTDAKMLEKVVPSDPSKV